MRIVELPSGAKLEVAVAPFETAKALYMALAAQMKDLKIEFSTEINVNFMKDIACAAVSSKEIESALWACLARCTYNGLKITKDTFEPEESRQDYMTVCFEVAKDNVAPFLKSLFAKFEGIFPGLGK